MPGAGDWDTAARVKDTPPLEQAIENPQVRVRCTPQLALAMGSPLAQVQETPPLALVLVTLQKRVRCTRQQANTLQAV